MKKSIGLPVKPPAGICNDENCAWHGKVPVRGRAISAVVKSAKAQRTAIVLWHYNKLIPKYDRYERRKVRLVVHNPDCIKAKAGDRALVAECRPLSKTKSFVIVGIEGNGEGKG